MPRTVRWLLLILLLLAVPVGGQERPPRRTQESVEGLIRQLGDPQYVVRQRASRLLSKAGERALPVDHTSQRRRSRTRTRDQRIMSPLVGYVVAGVLRGVSVFRIGGARQLSTRVSEGETRPSLEPQHLGENCPTHDGYNCVEQVTQHMDCDCRFQRSCMHEDPSPGDTVDEVHRPQNHRTMAGHEYQ